MADRPTSRTAVARQRRRAGAAGTHAAGHRAGAHASSRSPTRSAHIVLSKRTGIGWFIGFAIAFALLMVLIVTIAKLLLERHRHLGQQRPGRLGLRHHQLRLVDRHRPRRHADLGDSAAVPAAVAHLDQPLRRGDDAVRRRLRGDVPAAAHRPAVAGVYWLFPYPNTMDLWPQFRSPLIWDVFAVSTYATVSVLFWYIGLIPDLATLRDRAQVAGCAASSTACSRSAGAARPGTGTATRRPTCCWPASRRRWCCRCTRSSASTSRSRIAARLARDDLPALLRRRRHLLRLRDGADARRSRCASSTAWKTSSPCGTSTT